MGNRCCNDPVHQPIQMSSLCGDPSAEILEGQHYSDNALSETEVDCILFIVQLV